MKKGFVTSIRNNLLTKSLNAYFSQDKAGLHYIRFRSKPIINNCILYNSYQGAGMICNPYAIFKNFLNCDFFGDYLHVWVISDIHELNRLRQEYKQYPNVKFISRDKRNVKPYAKYMAKAKYIVENVSFPSYFSKRAGQITINTWHSITVKTLGFDMPNGRVEQTHNVLRSFLQTDYIISANSFMTNIFKNSYKLQGLYEGTIVEEGHPRNDVLINSDPEYVYKKMAARGIFINRTKKVILYAPTWRGGSGSEVASNYKECIRSYKGLHNALNEKFSREYQIIVKPHQYVYKQLTQQDKNDMQFVPQHIDANELLSIVDVLISDYSSIYFDFMLTNRPIVFYIPDLEEYKKERGIYFKPDELPGPTATNVEGVCRIIENIESEAETYKEIYTRTKDWACHHDDGHASRRIIDMVFGNAAKYNACADFRTHKMKLLFNVGLMANNGVTESFLSLLNRIDYDKYDVSVLCKLGNEANINRMHENVRVFVRTDDSPVTLRNSYNLQRSIKNGHADTNNISVNAIFETEFVRCFGNANFDYTFDYCGSDIYYQLLFEHGHIAKNITGSDIEFLLEEADTNA